MAQDMSLEKRLEGSVYDGIGNLQDIAEEMFARFCVASSTAAEEKAKNRILMQEIRRLEQENEKLGITIQKMVPVGDGGGEERQSLSRP